MERGLIKTSAGYMHFRATGKGKPVILMHPTPQSSAMFLELMEVMGRKMRVFAIDYPSYGCSDHLKAMPLFPDYARFVTEFMDGVGLKKSSFLGEAVGSFISVELANSYPDRVEKIVLGSMPFWPERPGISAVEYNRKRHEVVKHVQHPYDSSGFPVTRTLEFVLEKDPEHIPLHPTQEWVDRDNQAIVAAGRERWQVLDSGDTWIPDLPKHLERIACPVLLMWGDHFFYLQYKDEVIRRVKNNQVVVIKDGRFNIAWEHPEEVGAAALKFLLG